MEEAYRQARKRGEQGRRRAISQSEHPYLTDLDSLVAQLPLGQRVSVGLRDIPLEMVVGTVTKGRQSAFSCNFMPLLPFNTEFARKWSNLYDIQVTEGYRDPIIVTEFMHRFYVQEGNKRVSVLKFLDAPTVSARVTRLYPGTWDSVESRLYGEFCAFWRVCPLYEIEFSREGSYETLAKMLQRYTRDFNVLNAKNHEREAEIVAQAGKKGAITIATNMAGRGTDIMLGGNAEFMAKAQMRKEHFCEKLLNPEKPEEALPAAVELLLIEADGHGETTDANILAVRKRFDELYAQYKPLTEAEAEEVRAAGGLFIIGTERHESRRIDNQLRGRAGRQGDPGASRFYLSLEDDLMRLFGGDRVQGLMGTLGIDEDTPIENRMITSTIESAQKKLEGRNFEIRKNVLKYDDVMNQQREIIYGQRRKVLDGEDISAEMHNMLKENIESSCKQFLAGDVKDEWDFGALRRHYLGWLTTDADFHYTVADYDSISQESIADMLYQRGMDVLNDKEQRYGAPLMRELERICLLKCVDRQWMDHIDNMDQLRQGIVLRGYGQKDPVVEYRIEGFDMFDQMVDSIRESSVKMLLTIEVREAGKAPKREQVAKPTGEGYVPGNGAPGAKGAPKGQPVRVIKIGRNDPCPCGSGLKWKKCTCAKFHPEGLPTDANED